MSGEENEQGRVLVLAAFDEARASGRRNWQQMTTAVLKNRLLSSTNRAFDEKSFGVSSMVDFVRLFPDDLKVDTESIPPLVTLRTAEQLESGAPLDVQGVIPRRIRPDLWRAVVDYSSGVTYVWDEAARVARPADEGDENPVLPTVSGDEVAIWRDEFIGTLEIDKLPEPIQKRLEDWRENGYGASFLPGALRGVWKGFFRGKVFDKVNAFFSGCNLAPPVDLAVDSFEEPTHTPVSDRRAVSGRVESLRALVQRCVAVMSEEELADLRISPAVLLRVTRR